MSLGAETLHVAILESSDLLQKGKVIDSIMTLASLRSSLNQLYLAAPRLLGTTIEAEVFRSHGIGLLLFDDRRIDETVAPQMLHPSPQEPSVRVQDPALVAEVSALKSMYLEMERTIAKLREDLRSYQESRETPPPALRRLPAPPIIQREDKFTSPGAELPSFFVNNPWLEVLSKRGTEETRIAG
jgi:hypothetical protein